MIVYKQYSDGCFIAGDTDTGMTARVYFKTEEYKREAQERPEKVAARLLGGQTPCAGRDIVDERNWHLLEEWDRRL